MAKAVVVAVFEGSWNAAIRQVRFGDCLLACVPTTPVVFLIPTMPASNATNGSIEQRSLNLGKWANLLMAALGITAAYASRSDSLLVDGLYSGVNFFSAIIATRVALSISRPADQRFPFGYDAYEALYVKYRSLVLLGIIVFAIFGAVSKLVIYANGGEVPELRFGPILIYMVVMIFICFGLAFWHHRNWRLSGKKSDILKTESRAAVVDGIISAGAGGGLLGASLLRGTSLEFIVPVSDSIVVLFMAAFIINQPIQMFLQSLREVAGGAADAEVSQQVRELTAEKLREREFEILEVAVTKIGRTFFVIPYLNPAGDVSVTEIDELRVSLEKAFRDLLGSANCEIIVTRESPYSQ